MLIPARLAAFLVVALIALGLPSPASAQSRDDAIRIMREVAAQCPRAYRFAHADHNTHRERLDFIILAAQALNRHDPLWGMNGKRGNASDPSADAIAYGVGRNVRVWDVIRAAGEHGNNLDNIVFQEVTGHGGAGAIFVNPFEHRPVEPCGGEAPTPAPPASDVWTARHQDLRQRLGTGATTQTIAEQLAYSFPGEAWGVKSADPSRPVSIDVIARQSGGRLIGVRVLPMVASAPFDITGQHFIAVAPVNHVGDSTPAPTPEPPAPSPAPEPPPLEPPTPPALPGVEELRALLATMAAELAQLRADVAAQRQEVIDAVRGQTYDIRASSRVFGVLTGEITPRRAPQ